MNTVARDPWRRMAADQVSSPHSGGIVGAVWLNQQGAMLLLAGSLGEAANWFEAALQQLNFPLPRLSSRLFPIATIYRRDEDQHFSYDRPFFLSHQSVLSAEEMSAYVAVILFNLALTYHIEGQVVHDGGSYLIMAKKLYTRCLDLLLNTQWKHDCSSVVIACLNNSACVSKDLYCLGEAYQMVFLLTLLITEGKVRTDIMAIRDLGDIALNVPLLLMPICAGSA